MRYRPLPCDMRSRPLPKVRNNHGKIWLRYCGPIVAGGTYGANVASRICNISRGRLHPTQRGHQPNRRLDDMDIGRVQGIELRILQRDDILRIMRDYNV